MIIFFNAILYCPVFKLSMYYFYNVKAIILLKAVTDSYYFKPIILFILTPGGIFSSRKVPCKPEP